MARRKSGFLQGMGKAFEILRALTNAISQSRYRNQEHDPDEVLSTLLTDVSLPGFIAHLMLRRKHHIFEVHTVKVDYSMAVFDRVESKVNREQLGPFAEYRKHEEENRAKLAEMRGRIEEIPLTACEVHLLQFDYWMPPKDIISEMKMLGFKPGGFYHLMALAESGKLPEGRKVEALGTDLSGGEQKLFFFAGQWVRESWGLGVDESEHLIPPLFLAIPL